MNIVYILGNGFDKAQGMATSYPEFYRYLVDEIKEGSFLLNKMKSEITEKITLWSDMEIGLGEFTNITDNITEFDDFYFELNELLQKYLKTEDDKFIPSDKLKAKFQSDFIRIEKYLGDLDKERFNTFIKDKNFSLRDISVITFNYTNTLEKILALGPNVTTKTFGGNIILKNLIHVHGKLNNSIIIGVDNEDQIKNTIFCNNNDIKDCMIKKQSNLVMKETRHFQCEKLISNAHIIILMGVSLGDTDQYWWEIIGKNLTDRNNLVIIQHLYNPNAINPMQMQKRGRLERRQQDLIMQKMRIKEENWTDELRNRLFFTVNEPIFKL